MGTPDTDFYAVAVGVGGYASANLQDLPATVTDARLLCEALIDPLLCHYAPERTHLLTGAGATLDGFRDELAWLARETRPTSTALIYFSGHGGRLELPLEAAASYESFLCLREAEPERLRETALSATEFAETLRRIHAGRLVVVLDSCFAAGAASFKAVAPSASVWREGLTAEALERLGKGSGRVAIASSSASQVSLVREQGDVSLFTYHLLEALKGAAGVRRDGYIHVLDVFHYVSEAIREQASRQTPILKADDLDSNFPIAFDHGGKPRISSDSAPTGLREVRERIRAEPLAGAEALEGLSERLPTLPDRQTTRTEVERLRAGLREIQQRFAASQPVEALIERERIIYLLLELCARLEERAIPTASAASAAPDQRGAKFIINATTMTGTQFAEEITNHNYFGPGHTKNDSDPDAR
ncbi:MAG TPA: caspase family protein [Ktedonobacterales bacterium]|nr:caspase family protein [Ktedonobacterales bacterium]